MTTKEKILKEAEKQFIEFGISGTQIKEIALAIDINRRTLYRYFPTKDELAFEVEIIVMKQIAEYLAIKPVDTTGKTGHEKVKLYFDNINFNQIREQMKFTAEFDRYFQDEYPSKQLEDSFIKSLDPVKDQLYQYICDGIKDGSIRDDISADDLYHFISQNFFALYQRVILREKHLKNEYCDKVDFQFLFKEIILTGIRKN